MLSPARSLQGKRAQETPRKAHPAPAARVLFRATGSYATSGKSWAIPPSHKHREAITLGYGQEPPPF